MKWNLDTNKKFNVLPQLSVSISNTNSWCGLHYYLIISCSKRFHGFNLYVFSFCQQLCQARGFMCEICRKQEVIFPWDIKNVVRCSSCHSCHHIKCYQRQLVCPKCVRINNRNNLQNTGLCNSLDSWHCIVSHEWYKNVSDDVNSFLITVRINAGCWKGYFLFYIIELLMILNSVFMSFKACQIFLW